MKTEGLDLSSQFCVRFSPRLWKTPLRWIYQSRCLNPLPWTGPHLWCLLTRLGVCRNRREDGATGRSPWVAICALLTSGEENTRWSVAWSNISQGAELVICYSWKIPKELWMGLNRINSKVYRVCHTHEEPALPLCAHIALHWPRQSGKYTPLLVKVSPIIWGFSSPTIFDKSVYILRIVPAFHSPTPTAQLPYVRISRWWHFVHCVKHKEFLKRTVCVSWPKYWFNTLSMSI